MAALLAVFTFAVFITLDYFLERRKARAPAPARVETAPKALPPVEPVWVAGYEMPETLHYHPGHTWVRPLGPDTALVGMDDFARRLCGEADRVRLPKAGTWLLQGAKSFVLERDGRTAELVSPVEGEIIDVNRAADTEDPYGEGWFCKVRSANLRANLRNLLSGGLARRWMEDARERLEYQLMALSGSVLQDGGEPAPDFARHLEEEDWKRLVGDFLLT